MFYTIYKHKQRLYSILAGLLALILPPIDATALSLGELRVYSHLNQPLSAAVPVALAADESLADMHINGRLLTGPTGNNDANGPTLHLTVERRSKSKFTLRIGSDDAIQTTGITLKISLDLPDSQASRIYTALMDPSPELANTIYAATSGANKEQITTAENRTHPALYGPVAANETLWSIAESVNQYPDITQEQMVVALYRNNPHAFFQASINALKTGEFLHIPDYDTIAHIPAKQAGIEVRTELAQFRDAHSAQLPSAASSQTTPTPVEAPVVAAPPVITSTITPPSSQAENPPAKESDSQPTGENKNAETGANSSVNENSAPPIVPDQPGAEVLPATTDTTQAPPIPPSGTTPSVPAAEPIIQETATPTPAEPVETKPAPATDAPLVNIDTKQEDNSAFSWIEWLAGILLIALLTLTAVIPHYLARRKRAAMQTEQKQAQAVQARDQLKQMVLEDIQYPRHEQAPTPARVDAYANTEKSPESEPVVAAPPITDHDFGLSLLPLDENQPLVNKSGAKADRHATSPQTDTSIPAAYPTNSSPADQNENISAVISDLTDMDENETKLDLALTYADMGDSNSALTLLDEIFAAGNPKQQAEARKLLAKLNEKK